MSALFLSLLDLLLAVIHIYQFILLAAVIMSWLIAFNVVNRYQPVVATIWRVLQALTEPLLQPLRRILPNLGGIDISPVVLLLALFFFERLIVRSLYGVFA
jgi:YggT family protein